MRRNLCKLLIGGLINFITFPAHATEPLAPDPEFDELLALDIADLMVTSVSRREQKQSDAPAAVYVITQEEIRRAGVFTIPEALRLVPGVQVARVASNRWAISARGFNSAQANKLLVMIDGRSIYTPVFSGVYWDDQSTLIQDIDRIEVIRGPGASMWGANAVNGVINIVTKSAEETQDNLVSAIGSLKGGRLEDHHGGQLTSGAYYRAYLQYFDAGSSSNPLGQSNHDDWKRTRAGFRIDGETKKNDTYTVQGDVYGGTQDAQLTLPTLAAPFTETLITENESYGGNVLGRWNRALSSQSEMSLQAYIDHYTRKEANAQQGISTADIQFQNSLRPNDRHNFIWGAGARLAILNLTSSFSASFNEEFDKHSTLNTFLQDEYALLPDALYFTLGSKFEYNDFTGFEIQPTARLAWHPDTQQTVWASISRAMRTPSAVEEDLQLATLVTAGAPPTVSAIVGNPHQQAESLLAYELGYRIQPYDNISLDVATFYNDYDKLQTIGQAGTSFLAPDGLSNISPFSINNEGSGKVYGVEFAGNWGVTTNWKLSGTYSFQKMDVETTPFSVISLESSELLLPRHQFTVRSYLNLTDTVQWDNIVYYVSKLSPPVDDYLRYDMRLAWQFIPNAEVSLIGRNLLDPSHVEFPATPQAEAGRGVVGQLSFRF